MRITWLTPAVQFLPYGFPAIYVMMFLDRNIPSVSNFDESFFLAANRIDEDSEIRTNKSGRWIRWFNDEDFGYWNDRWLWDIESCCNNTMTDIPLSFDFSIRLSCQSVLSSRRSMATVVYLRFGQPFNFSNGNAKRVANVLMATCRCVSALCNFWCVSFTLSTKPLLSSQFFLIFILVESMPNFIKSNNNLFFCNF